MKAILTAVATAAIAISSPAVAQGPGNPPQGGMERSGAASMFLAHTGELKLSDAQVTRLAAIARKSSDRRSAMRASSDSMFRAMQAQRASNTTPAPRSLAPTSAMRTQMEKMRTAGHDDLRDAISVLTPDQQATVFEMNMRRGGGGGGQRMRGGMRRGGRPGMGQRGQMGQGQMRGGQFGPRPQGGGVQPPMMRGPGAPADSAGRRMRPAPRQPEQQ